MKKTNNNSKSIKHRTPIYRRPLVWILGAALLIGIILAIIFLSNASSKSGDESKDTSKSESSNQDDKPKAESEYTDNNDDRPEPDPKAIQYEGENPNELDELTGTVTGTYVENGTLTIMTTVDQYLNGSCSLSMTGDNTGDTYNTTSNLLADVSVSYCEPFNIPLSALTNDHYQIEITLSGNGKTGKIKDGVDL